MMKRYNELHVLQRETLQDRKLWTTFVVQFRKEQKKAEVKKQ
jgi:hypothetical protein